MDEEYIMQIDGKKTIVKKEQLKRFTMGKQIEVDVNGRKAWIQEHLLDDAIKLGATRQQRVVKPVPKELFVREIQRSEIKPPVFTQIPVKPIVIDPLPKIEDPQETAQKVRRTPVKSKSK